MSNSNLVDIKIYSPNHSGRRTNSISKIAIHHTAGAVTAGTIGEIFKPVSRQASCNYGIGRDNKIVLCVDEDNRSWCTSSAWCDNRAITIEVSNSSNGGNWPVSDTVLETLIKLVADICRRNGIKNCTYTGDKDGVLQKHEWYSNTNCPGPYLGSKFPYIASEVNKLLGSISNSNTTNKTTLDNIYRVRKSFNDIKSQIGAFKSLNNAIDCAKRNPGYIVFESNGKAIFPSSSTNKKSVDIIAKEVIDGNWGNGDYRVNKLRENRYDPIAVQNKVNEILYGNRKTVDDIAKEVINGDWGNGEDRKNRLEKAGYNYNEIQRRVNELI